jgi:hypothetical protein
MSGPVPSFTMFPGPRWMDTEPHQPGRIHGGTFRGWLHKKSSCVNQPFQRGATLERRMRNGPASSLARAVSPPSSWRRWPVRRAPSVSIRILAEILMLRTRAHHQSCG